MCSIIVTILPSCALLAMEHTNTTVQPYLTFATSSASSHTSSHAFFTTPGVTAHTVPSPAVHTQVYKNLRADMHGAHLDKRHLCKYDTLSRPSRRDSILTELGENDKVPYKFGKYTTDTPNDKVDFVWRAGIYMRTQKDLGNRFARLQKQYNPQTHPVVSQLPRLPLYIMFDANTTIESFARAVRTYDTAIPTLLFSLNTQQLYKQKQEPNDTPDLSNKKQLRITKLIHHEITRMLQDLVNICYTEYTQNKPHDKNISVEDTPCAMHDNVALSPSLYNTLSHISATTNTANHREAVLCPYSQPLIHIIHDAVLSHIYQYARCYKEEHGHNTCLLPGRLSDDDMKHLALNPRTFTKAADADTYVTAKVMDTYIGQKTHTCLLEQLLKHRNSWIQHLFAETTEKPSPWQIEASITTRNLVSGYIWDLCEYAIERKLPGTEEC